LFFKPFERLDKIKKSSFFFHRNSYFIGQNAGSSLRELYTEAEKKYADFEPVAQTCEAYKVLFPTETPRINYTFEMDYNNKVILCG
jgi:hypothetical protein